MAGVNHLRNKKEGERREVLDHIMKKAGDGDSLELVKFIDLMSASEVNLTEKDLSRLNRITNESGFIEKDAFLNFAKRSEVLKEHVDQQRKTEHLDRAVLAFKAIDKDNSGFITTAELGKMSQAMSRKKCEALMKKLDRDGDGKITLEEFRALFAEADK